MASYAAPPQPPQVTQQQTALADYAQAGAGGAQAAPAQNLQQFNSMDLVRSMLGDVTQKLENIAKILLQDSPQLVAYLKPAVNGIVMLANQLEAGKQQQGTGQGAPPGARDQITQAAMQEPQGAAGAVSAG